MIDDDFKAAMQLGGLIMLMIFGPLSLAAVMFLGTSAPVPAWVFANLTIAWYIAASLKQIAEHWPERRHR